MNDTTMSGPRLRSLLRQAASVAHAGKRAAAEQLYREILAEAPESAAAWVGLAGVAATEAEQAAAYEQALALEPDNAAAQKGLAALQAGDGETAVADPASDPFTQSRAWLDAATAKSDTPPAADPQPDAAAAAAEPDEAVVETLFCYRHPNRETGLRCYSCNKPICSSCAVLTPVGYRCPVCIREAEGVFYTAKPLDYVLAPLAVLPLALVAGYLATYWLGLGFFTILIIIFAGGAIGNFVGRIALRVAGKRRGRYLPQTVATAVVIGVMLPAVPVLLVGALSGLISPGVLAFMVASSAYYYLR